MKHGRNIVILVIGTVSSRASNTTLGLVNHHAIRLVRNVTREFFGPWRSHRRDRDDRPRSTGNDDGFTDHLRLRGIRLRASVVATAIRCQFKMGEEGRAFSLKRFSKSNVLLVFFVWWCWWWGWWWGHHRDGRRHRQQVLARDVQLGVYPLTHGVLHHAFRLLSKRASDELQQRGRGRWRGDPPWSPPDRELPFGR